MIERRTLDDQVYRHLLSEVVAGLTPAGTLLAEATLALRLGVPRSAIRDAVWRLRGQGLVEIRRSANRGGGGGGIIVVRPFGPTQVRQLFQVREALEAMAAELACGRLTPDDFDRLERLTADIPLADATHHREACHRLDVELHAMVARRCGNPALKREIDLMSDLVDLVRCRVGEGRGALTVALKAHLRIIEALQENDAPNARRLMAEHVRESAAAAALWGTPDEVAVAPAGQLTPARS